MVLWATVSVMVWYSVGGWREIIMCAAVIFMVSYMEG